MDYSEEDRRSCIHNFCIQMRDMSNAESLGDRFLILKAVQGFVGDYIELKKSLPKRYPLAFWMIEDRLRPYGIFVPIYRTNEWEVGEKVRRKLLFRHR